MTLRRKGTRPITVNETRYRWVVAPDDEPGMAIVAELAEDPRSRLVSWVEHGVTVTPGVVRFLIERGLSAGWNPQQPHEVVQRLRDVPGARGALEQCPCCDYFTLAKRGQYDICPACFWEDDGVDLNQPDLHSGPNHMTLTEGRANFRALGACDEAARPHVLSPEARRRYAHTPRVDTTR
jgi:hypothetical protein